MIESLFIIGEIFLSILALTLLIKIFKSETIIDKVMAADCIDILLGIIMVLYGAQNERSLFIDLGLIVILLGFIGTVLICKYLGEEL